MLVIRGTKLVVLFATACTVVAGCSGGGGSSASSSNSQLHQVELRLDYTHTGKDAMWTYGIQQGYFKDAGIDLKVGEGKGSTTTAQTVATGSDQFGIAEGGAFLTTVSKGVPDKAVMSVYAQSMLAVLSAEKSAVSSPKGLEGKKVAVTEGDGPSVLLTALMRRNGVDPSKVNTVSMQPAAKLTSLLTGGVDGVATNSLVAASLEAKGTKIHVMPYADFGVNPPGYYLVTSNKLLSEDADLVHRFVGAASKSLEATVKDPSAAVDSFVKQYPDYNRAIAQSELNSVAPLIKPQSPEGYPPAGYPLGWISEPNLVAGVGLMHDFGDLQNIGNPSDYYTQVLTTAGR